MHSAKRAHGAGKLRMVSTKQWPTSTSHLVSISSLQVMWSQDHALQTFGLKTKRDTLLAKKHLDSWREKVRKNKHVFCPQILQGHSNPSLFLVLIRYFCIKIHDV
jgi:hypothetical protein